MDKMISVYLKIWGRRDEIGINRIRLLIITESKVHTILSDMLENFLGVLKIIL